MDAGAQHGVTLWELMMALTVAGIVLGIGVPSFVAFQRSNAMAGAVNEFVTAAHFARSEAVKRQVPVTLCVSPDPSASPPACGAGGAANAGLVVFVDENGNDSLTDATDGNAGIDADEPVLLRRAAPGGTLGIRTDSPYIAYAPNGFPRRASGHASPSARLALYCDDRGNRQSIGGDSAARVVRIEPTGRTAVRRSVAAVEAAVAELESADIAVDCPR